MTKTTFSKCLIQIKRCVPTSYDETGL
jgi:hypothetical protein